MTESDEISRLDTAPSDGDAESSVVDLLLDIGVDKGVCGIQPPKRDVYFRASKFRPRDGNFSVDDVGFAFGIGDMNLADNGSVGIELDIGGEVVLDPGILERDYVAAELERGATREDREVTAREDEKEVIAIGDERGMDVTTLEVFEEAEDGAGLNREIPRTVFHVGIDLLFDTYFGEDIGERDAVIFGVVLEIIVYILVFGEKAGTPNRNRGIDLKIHDEAGKDTV